MLIAALFTIAKRSKQPKCPSVNEWIKKLWYIYTMGYYTTERKKELLPFATALMELENIMLSELSQLVKTNTTYLIYMRNLMNKNKLMNTIESQVWKHGTD